MYSPHHIAFSVSDNRTSVDFYKKLGFEELSFWEAEDKSLSITHLSLNGLVLELFATQPPNQPLSQFTLPVQICQSSVQSTLD